MSNNEWVECPHCNGKKMEVPDCEECEGRGWVDDPGGGTMTCPECDGEYCSVCGGEGYVAAQQSVQRIAPSVAAESGDDETIWGADDIGDV